jgi:predicted PurR-regulated permease PerM
METIIFLLTSIILYFISDWILHRIEKWRGERFTDRTLIFFIIIFVLATGVFALFRQIFPDTSG